MTPVRNARVLFKQGPTPNTYPEPGKATASFGSILRSSNSPKRPAVVASAGSDEKVASLKWLGADVVFNYKTEDTEAILERAGGIDIYWHNVGGQTLEAALRTSLLGSSAYNPAGYAPKNLSLVVGKEIRISGFIVSNLYPKYREHCYKEIPRLVAAGKIKYTEDRSVGLDATGDSEAILAVQKGMNTGKKVIVVAEE
ncbi:uncharacterized protein C8Q71DRAFT_726562 [Rhodofomes roseus]|uniref:Alcohol dehydrogenase-like C-terminal domain-containing protein n=1 Tax=Rhodofomes roseus TaxID=34475 RepID=A0ABQ8K634_9APHY|nr:uncharacterized protein C8Q71DRAFT_726562 [Rhodofomes roseus]KAH9832055.1 hypothetical protein C8Q71DRAFT_726562 [Rhodofomes roseus]